MDVRINWNYPFRGRHAMVGLLSLLLLATVSAQVTQPPASATGSPGSAGIVTNGSLPTSLSSSSSRPTPSPSPTNASSSSSNSTAATPTSNNSSSTSSNATHATSVSVTDAITTSLPLTTAIEDTTTASVNQSSSSSPSSQPSSSSPSITDETTMSTSMTTLGNMNTDADGMMTTTIDDLVTYELLTTDEFPTGFGDDIIPDDDGGIFTESFVRLLIIAGATAGSCIVLLTVVFLIVLCYHRRQRRKRNSRYYEFKKKDYKSKYERVEMQNSLARRDQPENTPIGGGWVFSSGNYHHDYDDDDLPRARGAGGGGGAGLRAVSPLAVATPLLKPPSITATASTGLDDMYIHDLNGVPDSGHGGSIPPDDSALGYLPDDSSAFGFSPSLEHDIELELSPLYRAMGAASTITGGSEVRDHSYIGGGDSDTISNGNESLQIDGPIRDVLFDSFGGNSARASAAARDEQVEL